MKAAAFRRLKFKNFSDFELLKEILYLYQDDYLNRVKGGTEFYIPISIDKIAEALRTEGELVFQRLYNHLNNKHSYLKDSARVHLFLLRAGESLHLINYPYMCAIYEDIRDKKLKDNFAIIIAMASFFISVLALSIQVKL